jgi:carbon monoxide dehydrogenase subunit G
MLKFLGIAAILIVVAVAAVLAYAATKPDVFRVQRSASINAPAEKIFPLINDFHSWTAWSPYEKKDPNMKRTFSGAEKGKGAIYGWEGDSNVGSGRIEITDTSPPNSVNINLDMIKPFEAHNRVVFTLEPRGNTTTVTWTMNGNVPFFAKVIHVFFNMDRMVGGDFEVGLANLKAIAEK